MEYASKGVGTAGLTTGIIGTSLGALSSGILGNILGGGNQQNYVSKDTMELQIQLANSQRDNAILTAELNTEKKMVEVFNASNDKINAVRDELWAGIREVDRKVDNNAATQAVINTQVNAQMALNTSNISQLLAMTKLVIPNSSVCPGWGTVSVTPTIINTGTTTA